MTPAISAHAANDAARQQFQKVSDEYFDKVYFPNQPTIGTLTGYHQYDTQLEDYSRKNIDAWIADLVFFERRVESIPAGGLDETTRGDREMVLANIRSMLLTLDTIRPWEKKSRQLLGWHFQCRLLADGAQIRFARRTTALAHRPRKADALAP